MAAKSSPPPAASAAPPDSRITLVWRRAPMILMAAILAGSGAFFSAPPAPPPVFRAEGLLLVNRFPSGVLGDSWREGNWTEEQFQFHAQVAAKLVQSPEVLQEARNVYQRQNSTEAPSLGELQGSISVATEVLADTAVRREVSPIVTMAITRPDATEATSLTLAWMEAANQTIGRTVSAEVQRRYNGVKAADDAAAIKQAEAETSRALQETRVAALRAQRSMAVEILSPQAAGASGTAPMPTNAANATVARSTTQDSAAAASAAAPPAANQGLLARESAVRVQLLQNPSAWAALDLQREAAAVSTVIRDAQTSITILEKQLATELAALYRVQATLAALDEERKKLREPLLRYETFLAAGIGGGATPDRNADLRSATRPVLASPRSSRPPAYVWALAAGLATGLVAAAIAGNVRTGQSSRG